MSGTASSEPSSDPIAAAAAPGGQEAVGHVERVECPLAGESDRGPDEAEGEEEPADGVALVARCDERADDREREVDESEAGIRSALVGVGGRERGLRDERAQDHGRRQDEPDQHHQRPREPG